MSRPLETFSISLREAIAAIVAMLSVAFSSAYAYGVKSQQVQDLQAVVAKHDTAIAELARATVDLRIATTELRTSIEHRKD